MATHSSMLAWKIRWTEKPGGLQSMGSQNSWTRLSTAHSTAKVCLETFQKYIKQKKIFFSFSIKTIICLEVCVSLVKGSVLRTTSSWGIRPHISCATPGK